ncbi:MAG: hypothetical protein JNJ52_03700 [Flavobacterium sp.]|nr:hypothetical protein [Flavobacterium sp.]
MKKELLLIVFILFFIKTTNAQIGIGTTSPTSTLDVVASNPTGTSTNVDGILIPRVTRQRAQSMTGIPTSTMIYVDDVTSGTATGLTVNVTSVGFYFFNGTIWEKISTGLNTNWSLTGNNGTTPGTNFIGTTDISDIRIKTNSIDRWNISNANGGQLQSYSLGTAALPTYSFQNDTNTGMYSSGADNLAFSTFGTQRMTIGSNGNVGINIAPSTYKLDVSSATGDAIFGHSNNVGGILGYETNFSFGVAPQTISGTGVYANNPAAGYTSIFAQSTGAATVAANISYSNVWMANYNYVDNASATTNPSVSYNQLNNTSTTLGGTQIAVRGFNNRATTTGNPGYSVGVQGLANSQFQDSYGIQGLSYSDAGISTGGYFSGNNYVGTSIAYSYVGGWINGATARKIVGTGTVSEIIPTENHGRVTLTCPESPEYWYQDYGTVEMINGKATIMVDEILADIIVVDEENPLRVICTPIGMPYFNGVTIMSQTSNSVEILELNGGTHSGKLQYQLVAKPKTNFGEGRFPQAPGPGYLKADKEPSIAKAKNQPNDGRAIFKWPSDHIVYKYNPEDYVSVGDVIPAGPNAGKIKLGNGKYGTAVPVEKPKQ